MCGCGAQHAVTAVLSLTAGSSIAVSAAYLKPEDSKTKLSTTRGHPQLVYQQLGIENPAGNQSMVLRLDPLRGFKDIHLRIPHPFRYCQ